MERVLANVGDFGMNPAKPSNGLATIGGSLLATTYLSLLSPKLFESLLIILLRLKVQKPYMLSLLMLMVWKAAHFYQK